MSVTPTPGKGVQVNLNEYARLRTSRTGPDFWYIDTQSLLCNKLAPFLPKMTHNEANKQVTATYVVGGKERLGDSVAANPDFSNVPAGQVRALRNVIISFLQEISEQPAGSPLSRLGDTFTLPIPSKAPELYRLYGTGKNKKLAIIWGISKTDSSGNEDTNSVATLQQMLRVLPNPRKENPVVMFITSIIESIGKLPRNARLALLGILIALIVALSWVCCSSDNEAASTFTQQPGTTQQFTSTQQPGTTQQFTPTQQPGTAQQTTPMQQPGTIQQPTVAPLKNLSVDNLPCVISVTDIKQMSDGKIHVTFKVTPRNGQMPHKVYIAKQEVKEGGITLGYKRYPKSITVSVIPTEGAAPIEAKLPISEN